MKASVTSAIGWASIKYGLLLARSCLGYVSLVTIAAKSSCDDLIAENCSRAALVSVVHFHGDSVNL
jgi:hypothetical protein